MMALQREQLTLELEVGAEPIAGRILGPSRDWIEFTGWLALVGALDRARGPQPPNLAARTDGSRAKGDHARDQNRHR